MFSIDRPLSGDALRFHRAHGTIAVQVLTGNVQFRVGGRNHRLATGDLLVVNAGVEHEVDSDAGGTFLRTLVEPGPAASKA